MSFNGDFILLKAIVPKEFPNVGMDGEHKPSEINGQRNESIAMLKFMVISFRKTGPVRCCCCHWLMLFSFPVMSMRMRCLVFLTVMSCPSLSTLFV